MSTTAINPVGKIYDYLHFGKYNRIGILFLDVKPQMKQMTCQLQTIPQDFIRLRTERQQRLHYQCNMLPAFLFNRFVPEWYKRGTRQCSSLLELIEDFSFFMSSGKNIKIVFYLFLPRLHIDVMLKPTRCLIITATNGILTITKYKVNFGSTLRFTM